MSAREPAVGAHESTATGRGYGPVDGCQAQRVVAGEDVPKDAREESAGRSLRVATNAFATPAHDRPDDQLTGRGGLSHEPSPISHHTVNRDALSGSINAVIDAVRSTIEVTPPELVADLMYRGIALAGGGALLRGLDRRLAQETRFPVYVAEDPLLCVVKGTGEVLEEAKMLEKVQSALASRKPPRTWSAGR